MNNQLEKKFYEKIWFMWVSLFLFAPLGIFLMWKHKRFSQKWRNIITFIFAGWFLIFAATVNSDTSENINTRENINTSTDKISEEKTIDSSAQKETEKKEAVTAENAKVVEEAKSNSSEDSKTESKTKALSQFNLKEVSVARVVDGDTIELTDGSKVRIIGVNTPESTTKQEPYGEEASNYTKSQLTGKTIYLEKDVSETDKYGRLLRYIWLDVPKEISDSEIRAKMFNANLLLNGYAQVSTYPPDVKYQEYFTKFNAEARNANKGLWAISSVGTTKGDTSTSSASTSSSSSKSSGQALIKGNISSKGEKIYHVPGGAFYDKTNAEQWFTTEAEAQAAGFRKSKR